MLSRYRDLAEKSYAYTCKSENRKKGDFMNNENKLSRKDELLQKYNNLGKTIEDLQEDRKQVLKQLLIEITPFKPGQVLEDRHGNRRVFVRATSQSDGRMYSFACYRIKRNGDLYAFISKESMWLYDTWWPVEGEFYDLSKEEN